MNNTPEDFAKLLNHEIRLLKSLSHLMIEERNSVEENQIDKLVPIADQKKQILDQIESTSRNRNTFLLSAVQAPTAEQRLQKYLDQVAGQQGVQLHSLYNELEQILQQCKEQNAVNAMLISMNQRHIERNLNILKGIDSNSVTYTDKGTTNAVRQKLGTLKA